MDTNKKFEEQDHPLKNTDNAFVQVGKNGEPVIPSTTEQKAAEGKEKSITITQKDEADSL